MKIIYLHQYFVFPEDAGGTRSYDLATAFVKKGHDVDVITSSAFIKKYEFLNKWTLIERDGLRIHVLNLSYSNNLSKFSRIVVFLKFLWYSSIKLLNIKGDLVLATSTPLTIGIPPILKKLIGKTPYIFEVRDVWPEAVIAIGAISNKVVQKALYLLEKLVYQHAAAVVPLSIDMRNSIVNRYPKFKARCKVVIENISATDRFHIPEIASRQDTIVSKLIGFNPRFSILYAGTFGKVNGIEYVVEVAKRLIKIDDTIVFILVGGGGDKDRIIQLAEDNKLLRKNIFILDAVAKSDLPNLYNEVAMGSSFVANIPELWANSANKFFDTLAASKPILINHYGWQSTEIINENIGYVLPPILSDESIFDFVKFTRNEDLIRLQTKNALKVALDKYSLPVATEKYLNIFDNIFSKKTR